MAKKGRARIGSANGTGGGVVDGTSGTKYIIKPPSAGQWNLRTLFSPTENMPARQLAAAGALSSTRRREQSSSTSPFAWPSPSGLPTANPSTSPTPPTGVVQSGTPTTSVTSPSFPGTAVCVWHPPDHRGLVANSEYHFYPSWTPDSKPIVFNTGKVPCKGGSGCNTYDPTNTILRLVRATPGAKPLTLTKAGVQANSGTNWPRVAPFIQDGKLVFFTFSARFPYGLLKSGSNDRFGWQALTSTKPPASPTRSSFPPFWLPFQNVTESNHLGTWTTDVVCIKNEDCPSEFQCSMGMCVPRIG